MQFRRKSDDKMIASAMRMAERKEAEGCSPCAEIYRQIAQDPSRRRLLTRGLLGAGALTAASLIDVGGALAAPKTRAGATALDASNARRVANAARGRVDVQALERHIGTLSTSVDAFTLHDDTGVNVGSATFLGYGSSVIVTLSSPSQDVIAVAALHQGRGLRVQSGRITEDAALTDHAQQLLRQTTHGTPADAVRQALGANTAHASCALCPGWIVTCGVATTCCATTRIRECCNAALGACAAMLNCCFG
jgi:hypothetical protein